MLSAAKLCLFLLLCAGVPTLISHSALLYSSGSLLTISVLARLAGHSLLPVLFLSRPFFFPPFFLPALFSPALCALLLLLSLLQVSIDEDTFKALEAVAKAEGKSVAHVASERLQQL